MKKTKLCAVAFVAAITAAIAAVFICAGCNDSGVESGGGDAVAFLKRFSESSGNVYGKLEDGRDGRAYRTVKIGEQTWMAENLNYEAENGNSRCYGEGGGESGFGGRTTILSDSQVLANCKKYGRLYDWATAMGLDASYNNESWGGGDVEPRKVCPAGWRLPSRDDWEILIDFVGGGALAGVKLRAKTGWYEVDKGTDDFGFSALPGGFGGKYGKYFSSERASGSWWSATNTTNNVYEDEYADVVEVGTSWAMGGVGGSDKEDLRSVRCIKNAL